MNKDVIELFAGVGGFRVGLNDIRGFDKNGKAIESRDWNFVWANQWEPSTKTQHAYECYTKRFGKGSCINEDINSINKKDIPDHSLLCGGFPCQDYSVARSLSNEKGIEGKKGVLFWDIAEILNAKKTPFVLLENVDRLLKSPARQRGRDFGIMLRTFFDLGYNVEWRVINAADYGCSQRRRRVFIFAWKTDTKYNQTLKKQLVDEILLNKGLFASTFPVEIEDNIKLYPTIDLTAYKDTVEMTNTFNAQFENTGVMIDGKISTLRTTPIKKDFIPLKNVRETRNGLSDYFLDDDKNKKFEYLRGAKKIERKKPNGELYYYSEGAMCYPDDLELPSRTMLTSEGSINRSTHVIKDLETGKLRLLTPVEAERLQHFPDDWTNTGMPEKRRYFMMGNALVTQLIHDLSLPLSKIIENE